MGKTKVDRTKRIRKEKNRRKYHLAVQKKTILAKIRLWDDPILKESCNPVINYEEAKEICEEMKRVLLATRNGVGLTASQIGITKRFIALRFDVDKNEIKYMLNPAILESSEETQVYPEACLSFPGVTNKTTRPQTIKVEYEDFEGAVLTEEYSGFEAVVICHEIDHTQGVCRIGQFWEENRNKELERRKKRMNRRDRRAK